jgi:hypothetical protein
MGGLYGSRSMVAAAKRIISRTFRPVARVQYFTRAKLNFAKSVLDWLRPFSFTQHLRKKIESASSVFDLLCGIPARDHLRGSGWRQTSSHPEQAFDPNSTGLIWVAPAIPATAAASREVAALITQCFQRYGFDPLMTISTVTERANVVVSSINYDSADAAQRQAAQECERVTKSQLAAAGYFAYRTSVHA